MKNSIYILFLLFAVSLNAQTFQQKDFSVGFPHEQPNQAVDILFGNSYINGWIEVDITGTYIYQNSVGIIKKLFQIGVSPSNFIWYPPTSRIVEAAGPILDNIYIGDIVWDPAINQYKLTIYHTSPNANPYNIRLTQHSAESTTISTAVLSNIYTNPLNGNNRHSVYYNDNVGIGVTDPKNKLDVNGTVHAKEVKVDMTGWADFVFEKDYHLPTLDEVEQHIHEKGHFPNIPNTKEVMKNGLSLGENQKLLLQKIEELTLYSIEQNKLNKEQSELLRQQIQINKTLEQRLQNLENNNQKN
ncbi:hypothetical protein J2O09_13355 [Elizabethkingia anophelis]|uniref:hypothetical protein n=1 Tax=Elizabethkingia anophelis TaxID=1117645 RepID=UPI0020B68E52|nr:hypothetical protein [Elizabethkingia anophelis]UTG60397.1 hypothetical protein J2O09_13355 [Elizabethkingia anophelis]UXM66597.1 hypothetical protein N7E57_13395 [Elizabethkingia anophelis]